VSVWRNSVLAWFSAFEGRYDSSAGEEEEVGSGLYVVRLVSLVFYLRIASCIYLV